MGHQKLNEDMLKATIQIATWADKWGEAQTRLEGKVAWFQKTIKEACDAAMPRARMGGKATAY